MWRKRYFLRAAYISKRPEGCCQYTYNNTFTQPITNRRPDQFLYYYKYIEKVILVMRHSCFFFYCFLPFWPSFSFKHSNQLFHFLSIRNQKKKIVSLLPAYSSKTSQTWPWPAWLSPATLASQVGANYSNGIANHKSVTNWRNIRIPSN